MENVIVISIVAVIVAFGAIYTIKHFKGEGGCCGGGSYKPKKKKLTHVLYQKTFIVDGMHCDHCKRRVEEAVNDLKGVSGTVNLKKRELTVSFAEAISDEIIEAKIIKAGYTVIK